MKVEIRPSIMEDVERLVASMQEDDIKAVMSYKLNPVSLIGSMIQIMDCITVLYGDEIAAMIFVQPINLLMGEAKVGVLSTSLALEHPLIFGRYCKICIDKIAESYPNMYGEFDPSRAVTRRWLRWLGFQVEDTKFFRRAA